MDYPVGLDAARAYAKLVGGCVVKVASEDGFREAEFHLSGSESESDEQIRDRMASAVTFVCKPKPD